MLRLKQDFPSLRIELNGGIDSMDQAYGLLNSSLDDDDQHNPNPSEKVEKVEKVSEPQAPLTSQFESTLENDSLEHTRDNLDGVMIGRAIGSSPLMVTHLDSWPWCVETHLSSSNPTSTLPSSSSTTPASSSNLNNTETTETSETETHVTVAGGDSSATQDIKLSTTADAKTTSVPSLQQRVDLIQALLTHIRQAEAISPSTDFKMSSDSSDNPIDSAGINLPQYPVPSLLFPAYYRRGLPEALLGMFSNTPLNKAWRNKLNKELKGVRGKERKKQKLLNQKRSKSKHIDSTWTSASSPSQDDESCLLAIIQKCLDELCDEHEEIFQKLHPVDS